MLKFILGRSGYGKTQYIKELLCSLASESEKKKLYYIVPEQNSFDSERSLIKMMGAKMPLHIEVLSFTRLCDIVFQNLGGLAGKRLQDSGRIVFMKMAVNQCVEQLELYGKHAKNAEFINMLIDTINEFKANAISPLMLEQTSKDVESKILKEKLKEIALIYADYEALVETSYIDPIDDLKRVEEKLKQNDFFKDSIVVIDSFYNFKGQQLKVINQILKQCNDLYLSLCVDTTDLQQGSINLFSSVQNTAIKIIELAKKNNISYNVDVYLKENYRHKSSALKAIEKGIFQKEKQKLQTPTNDVNIVSAQTKYDECEFVANEIHRLVRTQNYRFKDFAIIVKNSEDYEGIIDPILEKFNIEYFMDKKQNVDSKPLMVYLLTLLEIADKGYNSDLIFKMLKTGIFDIDFYDVDRLENYCFVWDISGEKWKKEWTGATTGFTDKLSQEEIETIAKLNSIRLSIVEPIENFKQAIQKEDSDILLEIYNLLENQKIAQSLDNLADKYTELNMLNRSEEVVRVWEILMDILDQLHLVLEDFTLSLTEIIAIFKIVLANEKIAFIPQGYDQVVFGGASRTRLEQPKITFIMGVNRGVFPTVATTNGIFSSNEKNELLLKGLDFAVPFELSTIQEKFLAYTCVTSSSQKIYLSYYNKKSNGEEMLPSEIIEEVKMILPNANEIVVKENLTIDDIECENQVWDIFAENIENPTVESQSAKKALQNLKGESVCDTVEQSFKGKTFKISDKNVAKLAFNSEITASPSSVDRFYQCSYSYFLSDALYIKPLRQAKVDALSYGTIIHHVLQIFVEQYCMNKPKEEFCNFTKKEIESVVEEILNDYAQSNLGGLEDKDNKFKYLFKRFINTSTILIDRLLKEFCQSEFKPFDSELIIGKNTDIKPITLPLDEGEISVVGKIDRVDILEEGSEKFVRVVDYKTGVKEYALKNIIDGINLQMFIYLMTISEKGFNHYKKDVSPAGVLYMPLKVDAIQYKVNEEGERAMSRLYNQLKMDGLLLEDIKVLSAMEKDLQGQYLPVKINSDKKSCNKYFSKVASAKHFSYISNLVKAKLIQMGNSLHKGEVEPNPIEGYCKYCSYKDICTVADQKVKKKCALSLENTLKLLEEEYSK